MPNPKKSRAPIPVDVENVGGIVKASVVIRPGCITEIAGANGEGKTTLMNCIRRAAGERVPLEVRDGAHAGSIVAPGVRLAIKQSVRSTGEAEVEIVDAGPLTRLIDPGLKGDEEQAIARCTALVELIRPTFDAGVVAELAGGERSVAAAVEQELREGSLRDLKDVAERVRLTAHREARAAEEMAKVAAGQATAAELTADQAIEKAGGVDALVDIPVAEAEQQETAARERLGALRAGHERRLALERQKAEISATLGEKPDPTRFDHDIELRRQAVAAADARLTELQDALREHERRIAQHREAMGATRADLAMLERNRKSDEENLRHWERQAGVLAQPIEGPEEAAVEAAEGAAIAAQELRRSAVVAADVRKLVADAEAAKEIRDKTAARAERLREIAKTVYERLSMLPGVAERAAPLTIIAGRVHVKVGDQVFDFQGRRSEGQRIDAAFAVAARAYAGIDGDRAPIVALDSRYWTALDPENRRAAARAAAEHGLAVVTELPTEGPLAVHHLTGAEPLAASQQSAEVSA